MAEIVVHAHYRDLLGMQPDAYDARLSAIIATHFASEPWEWMPRLSARHSLTRQHRTAGKSQQLAAEACEGNKEPGTGQGSAHPRPGAALIGGIPRGHAVP